MSKLRNGIELILQRGEMNIYRRILRTALWGSCVTFMLIGIIFLVSIFILHNELHNEGEDFSQKMGDYLEENFQEEVKDRLTEATALRAQMVGQLLNNCSLNVENLSEALSDILQDTADYKPKELPVANFTEVADNVPYVFYSPELLQQGISPELKQEVAILSSVEDDIRRMSRRYQGSILVVSTHGYLIRMDMLDLDGKGAVLSHEPLRSTYNYKSKEWYKSTIQQDRLLFTNPYMASYGRPCVSICAPYHDANGVAGIVVADINTDYICRQMDSSDVKGSNFSFIMDKEGNVIISTREEGAFAATDMNQNLRKAPDRAMAETAERMVAGERGIALVNADGGTYYLAYAPLPKVGWSLGTVIDTTVISASGDQAEAYVSKVFERYDSHLGKFFLITAIGATLLFILTLYPILWKNIRMAQGFAEPINTLIDGVKEIAAGNLDRKLSIKTGDELEALADSFNHMTEELTIYMDSLAKTTAQKEHIETELSVATRIQTGMLPEGHKPFPDRQDLDLAAVMRPAREVGGDFYDFYPLNDHQLVLTVADVSDKGVPAALFMVISKTLLKENLLFAGDPEELGRVFSKTNRALIRSNNENMFVTVFCGVLDTVTGVFTYVNAGHNPPVIRHNGQWQYMKMAQYPIMGVVEDLSYSVSQLQLHSGDALFLYTDGVTEAANEERRFFGNERLLKALTVSGDSASEGIEGIYGAVKAFAGNAAQSDDITMLELIYWGSSEERKESYENSQGK